MQLRRGIVPFSLDANRKCSPLFSVSAQIAQSHNVQSNLFVRKHFETSSLSDGLTVVIVRTNEQKEASDMLTV